jgi:hypothetical protein
VGRLLRFRPIRAAVALVTGTAVLPSLLSLTHLLPRLLNPLAETTTQRSSPVVLKSMTPLSRYEADSGTFQAIVDLKKQSAPAAFIHRGEPRHSS